MDLIALIAGYGGWAWIIAGLVLLGLELMVPGGILVWLGLAAIVTGLITLFQSVGWPLQWALFGILSILGVVAWLKFMRRDQPVETDKPLLNKRTDALVGRRVVLIDAITSGYGRARIDDTIWQVSGPELDAGQSVLITGAEGAVLTVAPVET